MWEIVDPVLDSIGIRDDSSYTRYDTTLQWFHSTKQKSIRKSESKSKRESDSLLYSGEPGLEQHTEWRLVGCDTITESRRSQIYCLTVIHFDSVLFRFWHDAMEGPYLRIGQEGWVLECMRVRLEEDSLAPPNAMRPFTVFVNGVDLNRRDLLSETFEYHHIDGLPFYLFRRVTDYDQGADYGYFYGGMRHGLSFDKIFHGACCEPGVSNPRFWERGCYFLGKRDGSWYLVTLTLP
jgi:hypothetical protein